eukprot:CAMPEP_0114293416 /NCGR_PEP_ID=MMETSP0059-20121206/9581_1 /TAXON_ID=36894 /ORGANISM="Pyramimonas parkeae, Strain CCMP726" /LENGTH=110 /DNA_ID=CAMNT_0001415125 /DNA_START=98 /DNA_END=431 /DNA_ORIENTATION=+
MIPTVFSDTQPSLSAHPKPLAAAASHLQTGKVQEDEHKPVYSCLQHADGRPLAAANAPDPAALVPSDVAQMPAAMWTASYWVLAYVYDTAWWDAAISSDAACCTAACRAE